MQQTIDINADVGEGFDTDAALLPYLSSANIACGAHAGSRAIFLQTATACRLYGVAIGAHPGFEDRANFGRLPQPWDPIKIYDLLMPQLELAATCCEAAGAALVYVKPHGALYNMSAADESLA
nr:LamB/YcsF family protein [Chitinophagaceae bacterium]